MGPTYPGRVDRYKHTSRLAHLYIFIYRYSKCQSGYVYCKSLWTFDEFTVELQFLSTIFFFKFIFIKNHACASLNNDPYCWECVDRVGNVPVFLLVAVQQQQQNTQRGYYVRKKFTNQH